MTARILIVLCLIASRAFAQTGLLDHIDRVGGSTVLVRLSQSSGTGFLLGNHGHIVTAAHVVEDSFVYGDEILIDVRDVKKPLKAALIAYEPRSDLALLKVDFEPEHFLYVAKEAPRELDQVLVAGFPFAGSLPGESNLEKISPSYNRCNITALRELENGVTLLQLDSQMNPGNSGGPAINANGNVVGVVSAGIMGGGINFLVRFDELNRFLKAPTSVRLGLNSLTRHSREQSTPIEIDFYFLTKPTEDLTVSLEVSVAILADPIELPLQKTATGSFKGTLPALNVLNDGSRSNYPKQVVFKAIYTSTDGQQDTSVFIETVLETDKQGIAVSRWDGPTVDARIMEHVSGPQLRATPAVKLAESRAHPGLVDPLESKLIVRSLQNSDESASVDSGSSDWQAIQIPPGLKNIIVVNSGKHALFNFPLLRTFGLFDAQTGRMTHYAQWEGEQGLLAGVGDNIYLLLDGTDLLRLNAETLEYEGGNRLEFAHPIEAMSGGLGLSKKLVFIGAEHRDNAMATVYDLDDSGMSTIAFRTQDKSRNRKFTAYPLNDGQIFIDDGWHDRFYFEHNDGYHEVPNHIQFGSRPATWQANAFIKDKRLIPPLDHGSVEVYEDIKINARSSIALSAVGLHFEELRGSTQGFRIYDFDFSHNRQHQVAFISDSEVDGFDLIHKSGEQLFIIAHKERNRRKEFKYAQLPVVVAPLPFKK
ncbi:MAG: S1 family peptidase [Opitutaceae bacterium]